jgi:hypothetical protein
MPKIELDLPESTYNELLWFARQTRSDLHETALQAIADRVRGAQDWLNEARSALVAIERGRQAAPGAVQDVAWSPSDQAHVVQFERSPGAPMPSRRQIIVTDADIRLPPERQKVVQQVFSLIDNRWLNGGLLARFYGFNSLSDSELSILSPEAALGLLESVASEKLLPAPLAGASVVYLAEGGLRALPLQAFGDSIFAALRGGAYSPEAPREQAAALTQTFLKALFETTPPDRFALFALDPGFSSYFEHVYWDLAFLAINAHEHWALLLCATDTD